MITVSSLGYQMLKLLIDHANFEVNHPPVDRDRLESELSDIAVDYLADLPLSTVMSLQLTDTLLDRVPNSSRGTQLHFVIYEVLKEQLWEMALYMISTILDNLDDLDAIDEYKTLKRNN